MSKINDDVCVFDSETCINAFFAILLLVIILVTEMYAAIAVFCHIYGD